jgi:single-stranded-DNA-specific exonuclease
LRGEEIRWLSRIGPFGIGNPQPMFLARGVTVMDARTVGNGDKHLKLRVRDGAATWPAIAFDLGAYDAARGDRIDIVYALDLGRPDGTLEIRIEDMRLSSEASQP